MIETGKFDKALLTSDSVNGVDGQETKAVAIWSIELSFERFMIRQIVHVTG